MILHPRRPTEEWLRSLVARQASEELTYDDLGATLGTTPPGYHRLGQRLVAGRGIDDMDAAREAIRSWAGHRAMKMVLEPDVPPLVEGSTMGFVVRAAPFPVWASGSCRIVQVIDEDRRFGFAYGTLPHHPESGEEAFLVHHRSDDTVEFEITAFSRPNDLIMRLAGPIGRWMQNRSMATYLDGFARAVARSA